MRRRLHSNEKPLRPGIGRLLGTAGALGMLAGCGTPGDGQSPGAWANAQIHAVQGNEQTRPAIVVSELATQQFPIIPDEPRPEIRSEKERNDLKASLLRDQAEGKSNRALVDSAPDATRRIALIGGSGLAESPILAADPPPAAPVVAAPTPVPAAAPPPVIRVPVAEPPPDTTTAVQTIYRQRLAESVEPVPVPRQLAPTAAASGDASAVTPPVLVPPAEYRRRQAALGFQMLEAFQPEPRQSSFQVATVRFGEGTYEMAAGQSAVLAQVVALFHQKGGRIRVVGHSESGRLDVNAKANKEANAALARGRAEAVARALIHLGIPGQRIYAGAAAVTGVERAGDEANIVIDY